MFYQLTSSIYISGSDVNIPSEITGSLIVASGTHKPPKEEQGKFKQEEEEAKEDNGMPYQERVVYNV